MIHTNITASTALDPITVTIKVEELLEIDNGKPVNKRICLETYDLSLQFTKEASHGRAYRARAILTECNWGDSRFRHHAARSLAFLARTGEVPLIIINPNIPGSNLYMLASHVVTTRQLS
ncbi:MAG: hypothetical protein GY934_10690 [Gammaproteobacteria bacterium]|nr:hypothetical protein [Gammaproteobacteria bacterium]